MKKEKNYFLNWLHSEYCKKISPPIIENLKDINEEVRNNNEFRIAVTNYLENHPLIEYNKYIIKAQKLYNKNHFNFEINKNTFKNIYTNWKNKTNAYTKLSIFNNKQTKNKKPFLRDYTFTYLYNKDGKKQFVHEQMIFISNYYIKKLINASHWYIDCTFVYPNDFNQLIVILYRDDILGKRFPGLYALINNKKEPGYLYLFKKIKNIISVEKSRTLNLMSYTVDYENALINALKKVFPESRTIGCYFHYCRDL